MDKFIDNPWLLRITALILAILLFFTVQPESKEEGTENEEEAKKLEKQALRDGQQENHENEI